MKHSFGHTVIEYLIMVITIGVLALLAYDVYDVTRQPGALSIGIIGVVEVRCISGYRHTVTEEGGARQLLDQNGRGIPCTH